MDCSKYEEMIFLAMDDALTQQQQQELEAHLCECENCRLLQKDLRQQAELLASLDQTQLPQGYHEKLMQRLQEEAKVIPFAPKEAQKTKPQKNLWKRRSAIAAAVLLVVLGGHLATQVKDREALKNELYQTERMLDAAEQRETSIASAQEAAPEEANVYAQAENAAVVAGDTTVVTEEAESGTTSFQASLPQNTAVTETTEPKTEGVTENQPVTANIAEYQVVQQDGQNEKVTSVLQNDFTVDSDSKLRNSTAEKAEVNEQIVLYVPAGKVDSVTEKAEESVLHIGGSVTQEADGLLCAIPLQEKENWIKTLEGFADNMERNVLLENTAQDEMAYLKLTILET